MTSLWHRRWGFLSQDELRVVRHAHHPCLGSPVSPPVLSPSIFVDCREILPDVLANEQLLHSSTAAYLVATTPSLLPWRPQLCGTHFFHLGIPARRNLDLPPNDSSPTSGSQFDGRVLELQMRLTLSIFLCVCVLVGVCTLAGNVVKYGESVKLETL